MKNAYYTLESVFCSGGGGGYLELFWVGVCHWGYDALTLY